MSGIGNRFIAAGYKEPKPLVVIDGKPIIEHVCDLFPNEDKFTFICNSKHLLETNMREVLKSIKPNANMFPREVIVEGNYYIAPLGCNTKDGQNKLNWNYERYGNFFAKVLTGDNLKLMYEVANAELERFLQEKLK